MTLDARHDRLTFDEPSHTYRLDGALVPSVTTVIGAVWPELFAHCTDFARDRGTVVHKAVHFAVKGTLDWDSVDPFLTGYVNAALRAIRELDLAVEGSECRVYHHAYRYAGTLDLIGTIGGKRAILDIKTGEPGWQAGLQLAAYAEAHLQMTAQHVTRRIAIHVKETGQYALTEYRDREDLYDFLAALRVYRRKAA